MAFEIPEMASKPTAPPLFSPAESLPADGETPPDELQNFRGWKMKGLAIFNHA